MPRRLPPDVARVVETFRELGEAARRGLHLAERVARRQVETAARHAMRLRRREEP